MKYAKIYLLILLAALIRVSILPWQQSQQLGSEGNPIKFVMTPSVDAQQIVHSADQLIEFLEKETGYHYTYSVPASFIAVVEAFGTDKADISIINTFSYLMAHEKYGARAVMRVVRRDGETFYRGMFISRVESGIDSLPDIAGKRIAYVDPASTSGYILPKATLDRLGIRPAEEVFAMKHDNVVTMVYQKQVDVGAAYYSPPDQQTGEPLDARARVRQQFPDVFKSIQIIGFTDSIPNDPIIVRKNLPDEIVEKTINALIKFQQTAEGRKALWDIYSVEGFIKTTDADYNPLREILQRLNYNLEELTKK